MINETEKKLKLSELDKINAGYPNADKIDIINKKIKGTKKEELEKIPDIFITENERLVEELPFGELSEDELDNVIAGRLR